MKKNITNIKRAVCIMANELRKAGYTLSFAFRKAWRRVKSTMTIRAAGVTYGNGQAKLQYLSQYRPEDIIVTLEREQDNRFDKNAIKIVVHIRPAGKRAAIGYIPKGLTKELARVIDKGIDVTVAFMGVIGGYSYKENYGALLNISI